MTLGITLAAAVLIGVVLGLLGGGGSILTTPVLIYLAGVDAKSAIAMSLFVVGATSVAGVVPHARAGRVRWRTGALFGAAGMIGAYAGGRLAAFVPANVLLIAFGIMMAVTAVAMLRGRRAPGAAAHGGSRPLFKILLEGGAVGLVTGLVGAGGGFLVVPALALLGGLPMPVAVGTSLLVIAMKSFAGLAGYLQSVSIDWPLTLSVTAVAIAGSLLGSRLSGMADPDRLRKAFGWFVVVMSVYVLGQELPPGVRPLFLGAVALAAAAGAAVLIVRRSRTTVTTVPNTHGKDSEAMEQKETRMYFAQHYLDCLSQASYLIGDLETGRAVVVDPRRDVSEYLDDAEAHGLHIEGVINTHFHADFLSGHLELAARTGAWIGYGSRAEAEFPIRKLHDRERIGLGEVTLEILETPGHTPESISVLVFEHADDTTPYGVLTGDALFIGDVGRPDLLASFGVTAEELGRMLYDSVQRKLMALPDRTRLFPAHGAGSACGKNLSTELQSTIGAQRLSNYACVPMGEREFVDIVTEGQPSAPGYFGYDAVLNRKERALLRVEEHLRELPLADVLARRDAGAVLVDARDPQEFAAGHLAGSLNVPADGRFAEQAGMVVEPGREIVVIAPEGREEEIIVRLARIGLDTTAGHLADPDAALTAAPGQVAKAERITFAALREELASPEPPLLIDVRNAGELANGRIEGSVNIPLAELPRRLAEIPADRRVVVHCAGGARSSLAASLLRGTGRAGVADLLGGYGAWAAAHAAADA
ncbi:TSUP family transporter [Actinocorallia libanotica]|uniref:Probable membrane transporter protein n=1 Tax=Actinocorallia libanotica TaxID=46162 RepID=A0ABN1QUA0_9ACTN